VTKSDLGRIIAGSSSWRETESHILALPSDDERQAAFALFAESLLLLDPIYQVEAVHRAHGIPHSLAKKTGLTPHRAAAITGVCRCAGGKTAAFRAFFCAPGKNPGEKETARFFSSTIEADWRFVISNTISLHPAADASPRQSRTLRDRLDKIPPEFFDRLRTLLAERRVTPAARKVPHRTQMEALREADRYYRDNPKGQLILPCGTGKTLAALWITERLPGNRVLVMLPSIALVAQILREWAANTSIVPFRYMCLCCDQTVGLKPDDAPAGKIQEMEFPVATDPDTVAAFLSSQPETRSYLFSTYQSSRTLSEAVVKSGITFDLGVYDESHRTASTDAGVWSLSLYDENVPAKKRLFMTATPKIHSPRTAKKAEENDIAVCSMDDPALYGKPFFSIGFAEAIKRGLITDYKVVVILVSDADIERAIRYLGRVVGPDAGEYDAKALAKEVVLLKAMKQYGIRKVFTFHNRVKSAAEFTSPDSKYGLPRAARLLDAADRPGKTSFFHVNGEMPAGEREEILSEFRAAETAVVSNAKCLTEGVDIPAVDCVAFIDRKNSLIDIVQACGRALRKAEWKDLGYIFIPVLVREGEPAEAAISRSEFERVWQVLDAMMSQDERLRSVSSTLAVLQAAGKEDGPEWEEALGEYQNRVEIVNPFAVRVKSPEFVRKIYSKAIEVTTTLWDFWHGMTLRHLKRHGSANARRSLHNPEG